MSTIDSAPTRLPSGLFFPLCFAIAFVGCTNAPPEAVPQPQPAPAEAVPSPTPSSEADTRPDDVIAIGTRGSVTSEVLGEERQFLVYTPPAYADSARAFPVLYLLDGDAHFHHVTGLVAFLANVGRVPPMIVVGISNTERSRDFTPSTEQRLPNSGGAENFVRFLETELIPTIEKKYRTQPYRILVGHSFGGLLTMHTLVEHPELFHAYVAVSPSLDWDNRRIERRAKELWKDGKSPDGFLYFTLGNELDDITRANQAFAAFLQANAPAQLSWSFELMNDEDHGTTPHRTIHNGLHKLFADWRLPPDIEDPAAIQAHYQALSKRIHLPVNPPENALNQLGYRLLSQDRNHEAIDVFRLVLATYPKSPNAYDSLGEALEKIGEKKEALANYELAVENGAAQADQLLDTFTQNRDRLRAQLGNPAKTAD